MSARPKDPERLLRLGHTFYADEQWRRFPDRVEASGDDGELSVTVDTAVGREEARFEIGEDGTWTGIAKRLDREDRIISSVAWDGERIEG